MRLVSCLYANHHPWDVFFPQAECVVGDNPEDLREKDILILHGGSDIAPQLYNKIPGKFTVQSISTRDEREWEMLQQAIKLRVPVIGLCRGGQMLCAAAGGILAQHVGGHSGTHDITTHDGAFLHVNSIHHQMMVPWGVEHQLLAWSKHKLSPHYYSTDDNGNNVLIDVPVEPELVYFPTIRGMAIQWHPEMMGSKEKATQYIIKEMERVSFILS